MSGSMHRAIDSMMCCGIPELFTGFFLRAKFSNFPPVQYEIFKVRLVCAYKRGRWQTSFLMWDYSIPGQIMPFFPVKIWEMKMQTLVKQSLFCVCIFLFCCVPILYQKQPIPSRELRAKKIGIRKRETVTIVKEKAVALQQFFLQNQDPRYSLSFLWIRANLTVTILVEKLK